MLEQHVHPTQLNEWKALALKELPKLFADYHKHQRCDYLLAQIHLAQHGNLTHHLLDPELGGEDDAMTWGIQVTTDQLAQAQQRDRRYPLGTNRWDWDADQVSILSTMEYRLGTKERRVTLNQ